MKAQHEQQRNFDRAIRGHVPSQANERQDRLVPVPGYRRSS